MSKNVNSSAFRKFDVDQYNDDFNFKDEENQLEVQPPSKSTISSKNQSIEINHLKKYFTSIRLSRLQW